MPESIVLTMLRAIGGDLAELRTDMQETKERLGLLATGQASLSRWLDRVAGDVQQIKRRLDIMDAPV